jgi:hypothetical protein
MHDCTKRHQDVTNGCWRDEFGKDGHGIKSLGGGPADLPHTALEVFALIVFGGLPKYHLCGYFCNRRGYVIQNLEPIVESLGSSYMNNDGMACDSQYMELRASE